MSGEGEEIPTYAELIRKLVEIRKFGFVSTHRTGPTGIGKTLEDLLEIKENNVPGPDNELYELKSGRKDSKSMLTLFTKSPLPPKANAMLLKRFGYSVRENGKLDLHTTVFANRFNYLKGKPGFQIVVEGTRLVLVTFDGEELGYWGRETLRKRFETKYPRLLYVKAETRGKGANEEFWFNEAWLLSGFDFDNFVALVEQQVIKVDFRIGQYPDGSAHDHGTGFRVKSDALNMCFKHRRKIL